jgi:pyruvate dehydrogenase E1 component beta subunit
MVTAPHVPVPFAENLEDLYIPDANQLMEAIHSVMGKK